MQHKLHDQTKIPVDIHSEIFKNIANLSILLNKNQERLLQLTERVNEIENGFKPLHQHGVSDPCGEYPPLFKAEDPTLEP